MQKAKAGEKAREYAPVVLRLGISLVFLWFGLNQVFDAESWVGWLPRWLHALPVEPMTFVFLNGIFEVFFGTLLFLGLFTRVSALLLSLHLGWIVATMASLGFSDIAVRDFGLCLAAFSIFLYGPDAWTLDRKISLKRKNY